MWRLAGSCALALAACRNSASPAAEIADRGWRAHDLVITAGERATSCAEAGAAMQQVFGANRRAFVDALALDRDPDKLAAAIEYVETHEDRYADLEPRMAALRERCADDATVRAVFHQMESP